MPISSCETWPGKGFTGPSERLDKSRLSLSGTGQRVAKSASMHFLPLPTVPRMLGSGRPGPLLHCVQEIPHDGTKVGGKSQAKAPWLPETTRLPWLAAN